MLPRRGLQCHAPMGGLQDVLVTKRVYDDASDHDGYRVLVDRLWPRGMSKERAALDLWLEEIDVNHARVLRDFLVRNAGKRPATT